MTTGCWGSSPTSAKTLGRWLGQRYSRPAVPDEDYELITRPIRGALTQLVDDEPEVAQRFNSEYAEWRYRRETDGALTIFVASPREDPDAMTALEVTDLLTQALDGVYPGTVAVATDRRSYARFTKADELTTEQVSMEWASHDEASRTPPARVAPAARLPLEHR